MLGHRQLSAAEYLGIWRRRRKWAALCCLLGAAAGYGMARVVPAKYTSSARVLVTEPRVPGADVERVATEPIAARLAAIQENVLTAARLQALIERLGLYPSKRNEVSMEELVGELRKDIVLAPVEFQPGSVNPALSPPAFTASCIALDRALAQRLCSEVVALFLQSSIEGREGESLVAADVLAKSVEEAKRKRAARDAKLAAFMRRHAGEFPGDDAGAMESSVIGYKAQLDATREAFQRAQQERTALTESILAEQSVASQGRKTDSANTQALEQELATQQAQLVMLEARYTPDHPDVLSLKTNIERLQRRIDQAKEAEADGGANKPGGVPATESAQVAKWRARIRELDLVIQEETGEQERLQQQVQNSQVRLANRPILENEYGELTRESKAARSLYDGAVAKQNAARMQVQLGPRQQREVFLVSEPANLPALPPFPNPILFTLWGAGGGLGLGMLVVLAGEWRDKTLRTEGDVRHFLDLPTLAVIPPAAIQGGSAGNGRRGSRSGVGKRGEKEAGVLTDA